MYVQDEHKQMCFYIILKDSCYSLIDTNRQLDFLPNVTQTIGVNSRPVTIVNSGTFPDLDIVLTCVCLHGIVINILANMTPE